MPYRENQQLCGECHCRRPATDECLRCGRPLCDAHVPRPDHRCFQCEVSFWERAGLPDADAETHATWGYEPEREVGATFTPWEIPIEPVTESHSVDIELGLLFKGLAVVGACVALFLLGVNRGLAAAALAVLLSPFVATGAFLCWGSIGFWLPDAAPSESPQRHRDLTGLRQRFLAERSRNALRGDPE